MKGDYMIAKCIWKENSKNTLRFILDHRGRYVYFSQAFPLSPPLLPSLSPLLSGLVAPTLSLTPHYSLFSAARKASKARQDRKVRCTRARGRRWRTRDPFVPSWLSCRSPSFLIFPPALLFLSSTPDIRRRCIYKRRQTPRSLLSPVTHFSLPCAIYRRENASRKLRRIDREKPAIRMRSCSPPHRLAALHCLVKIY